MTNQIMIDFQTKVGAKPDGVFGKETLKAAAKFYKFENNRAAHFFAQCAHESANFTTFKENLNYSTSGLLKTFSKYFNIKTVMYYARNPMKIANKVYANRMGNGNEASGDGWIHRGFGAIQLTGKASQEEFAKWIMDEEVLKDPSLIATKYPFESAMFFFEKHNLWSICDEGISIATIKRLTKRINGGYNGLQDRTDKTIQYSKWLNS